MEIVPGLYRLPSIQGVNAYVWHPQADQRGAGEPILFDCGFPWSGRALVASLVALGCQPTEVRTIAITHDDVDHAGRLASLRAVSGAEVIAHALEAPRFGRAAWRDLPGLRAWGSVGQAIGRLMSRAMPQRPVAVTRPVQDGDALPGGWIVVHTPGHTPGHAAYFHPERRILIAGDALGSVRDGRLRPPEAFVTEDPVTAAASVRKLAALEPDVLCCGHGLETHDAAEALKRLAEAL
jgi:glyoxylase-like metal-dependent hydrolase (beta-lactamase superfamily II)